MSTDSSMNTAHIEAFLASILTDSEDCCLEDPEDPGYVKWLPMKMDPRDFRLVKYPDEGVHPLHLDWDVHGSSHAITVTTLIYLRHWWYESEDYLTQEGVSPDGVIDMMAGDVGAVIQYLGQFLQKLQALKTAAMEQPDIAKQAMRAEALAAKERRHLESNRAQVDLLNHLTAGPMEQLALSKEKACPTP